MSHNFRMKNVHNLQIEKLQLRVLLSICLIFCQFQPGVAYKGVACKKASIIVRRYEFYIRGKLPGKRKKKYLKLILLCLTKSQYGHIFPH